MRLTRRGIIALNIAAPLAFLMILGFAGWIEGM